MCLCVRIYLFVNGFEDLFVETFGNNTNNNNNNNIAVVVVVVVFPYYCSLFAICPVAAEYLAFVYYVMQPANEEFLFGAVHVSRRACVFNGFRVWALYKWSKPKGGPGPYGKCYSKCIPIPFLHQILSFLLLLIELVDMM